MASRLVNDSNLSNRITLVEGDMKAAAINRAMHQGSLVAQVALLRRI